MRFLLVNPYYPISETPSPPLGLACLSAALERAGVEVKIFDLVVFPYSKKKLESVLKDFLPHFVGATAVTMTFDNAASVLRDTKNINPDILTVMGGPHVTFYAVEAMKAIPEIDLIVLGEGDETIVDLVKAADNGCNWDNIKGIVYREGFAIRNSGFRKSPIDIDSLPVPARHLVPLGRYRALGMPISMTTSRGCPFRCIFCVGRKMVGSRIRLRNPEKVVDELGYLNGLGFLQINIADDLFTANEKHCLAVCDGIIRSRLKANWTCFGRVDTVSRRVLARMKEAGCHVISFGVESANAGILKTVKKGITIEQVIEAINICLEVGITPHISFILGLPGETPETLKETTEFGKKLKDMGASYGFHLLAPFPGTEVREQSDKFGMKILTNDWTQYHANRAIVETGSVNKEMLDRIVIEWENDFNEWLGEIKRRIGTGEATEDEAFLLTNLEHTVIIYDLMMKKVIEDKGSWPNIGKPLLKESVFRTLTDRVASSTDFTNEQVNNTLNLAVKQENLRWREDKGYIRWEWVNFL